MNILALLAIQKIIFTIIFILVGIYLILAILKEIVCLFKTEKKEDIDHKKITIDYIKSPKKKIHRTKEYKKKSRRKRFVTYNTI